MKPAALDRGPTDAMKLYLKSILTAIMIAAVVLLFTVRVVAPSLPRVVGKPAFQQTVTLTWPSAKTVRVQNRDGSIRVKTHRLPEVAVSVDLRIFAMKTGQEDVAAQYAKSLCSMAGDDQVVEFVTEPMDRPDELDVIADYTLTMPEGANIEILSENGNVWVSAGCGGVTVSGKNTDIVIKEPRGDVTAASTNGRIDLVDAPAQTRLNTVNGNIYAHMSGGSLEAATTNGVIVAHVPTQGLGACDLTSQNGGITLVMSQGCSAEVDARTTRGGIRSDFPVDTSQGVQRRRRLQGVVGSGDAKVKLETLNGNIWLARKDK